MEVVYVDVPEGREKMMVFVRVLFVVHVDVFERGVRKWWWVKG